MWQMVMEREIGRIAPSSFTNLLEKRRVSSIELACDKEIVSAHKSGINSLQRSSAVPSKKLALKSQRSEVKPTGPPTGPDLRTAHYGSVTGLQMTYDGLFLLSAGTDSRVRLWDVESGANTLVHYPSVKIRGNKGMQMALSSDSSLLFIPSANLIEVFNVWSGESQSVLRGHYDVINCCAFHPQEQELYSGSNDRQILVWAAPTFSDSEEQEAGMQGTGVRADEDMWSD